MFLLQGQQASLGFMVPLGCKWASHSASAWTGGRCAVWPGSFFRLWGFLPRGWE